MIVAESRRYTVAGAATTEAAVSALPSPRWGWRLAETTYPMGWRLSETPYPNCQHFYDVPEYVNVSEFSGDRIRFQVRETTDNLTIPLGAYDVVGKDRERLRQLDRDMMQVVSMFDGDAMMAAGVVQWIRLPEANRELYALGEDDRRVVLCTLRCSLCGMTSPHSRTRVQQQTSYLITECRRDHVDADWGFVLVACDVLDSAHEKIATRVRHLMKQRQTFAFAVRAREEAMTARMQLWDHTTQTSVNESR